MVMVSLKGGGLEVSGGGEGEVVGSLSSMIVKTSHPLVAGTPSNP